MNVTFTILNINSEQPEELLRFYRDVISLPAHPDATRESTLMADKTEIVFDGHSDLAGGAKEPPRTMLNVMVDDVPNEKTRLEAAGVRFLGPPSDDVISFATFVDPDGNYGQIYSFRGAPAGATGSAIMRTSQDPDRLRLFLRNVVGLSDDFPDLGNPFVVGGTSIYVGPHSEVAARTKEPSRAILNFFVDDVASEEARLEAAGVQFIRKQGREYWGGVISTFIDPDGNYLQLIQFKPE